MVKINKNLQSEEFNFIKLSPKSKMPIEEGWNTIKRRYDDSEILEWQGNYGIVIPPNYIVVDFDDISMIERYKDLLPKTFTVQTGSGKLHLYYRIDISEDFKIKGENGKSLIDILGPGRQVVGPGSIHPSNDKEYVIETNMSIQDITLEKLKYILRDVLPKEKQYKSVDEMLDIVNEKIKEKVKLSNLMSKFGYDVKSGNQKCMLGHDSEGGKCFSWDDDKGLWHCFNCGKGGTIFDFLMYHERLSFSQAKDKLLTMSGLENEDLDIGGVLSITNYVENVKAFMNIMPFIFDDTQSFWMWNKDKFRYEMVDNIDVMKLINRQLRLEGQVVKSSHKAAYLNAFQIVGREAYNKLKNPSDYWVQFHNQIYDYKTGEIFDATPKYFITNPIPHKLGVSSETPTIDKLFKDWVGDEYLPTLYEFIAFCCTTNYSFHKIFVLNGSGKNGKSMFLRLLNKFVGMSNICSTDLKTLTTNRFESAKLYKKLVCEMAETHHTSLDNSPLIKRLSGGDLVGVEMKNKTPIDVLNYAKIVIATNSLPTCDDTTDGFYRRWFIIDFPNQFKGNRDIVADIPYEEFENLSRKVTEILPILYGRGKFTNEEEDFEMLRKIYLAASNPLPLFIAEHYEVDDDSFVLFSDFKTDYTKYLVKNRKRVVSSKELNQSLEVEGYYKKKSTRKYGDSYQQGYWIEGLRPKNLSVKVGEEIKLLSKEEL